MIDNRTPRLGLLLPDADNYLEDDVVRLSESMTILDGKVATVGADGKIPVEQIPAVALTDTFTVDGEAAMLSLNAQPGDIAIRSDLSKSFVLMASPAATVGNWKELLNDALMQLAQPDGARLLGRCPDIATLRTIEPTAVSQSITVVGYYAGSQVGGGEFYYDASDTTTPDNQGTVIVTVGGKRWKRRVPDNSTMLHTVWFGAVSSISTDSAAAINAAASEAKRLVLAGIGKRYAILLPPKLMTAASVFIDPSVCFIKSDRGVTEWRVNPSGTFTDNYAIHLTRNLDALGTEGDIPYVNTTVYALSHIYIFEYNGSSYSRTINCLKHYSTLAGASGKAEVVSQLGILKVRFKGFKDVYTNGDNGWGICFWECGWDGYDRAAVISTAINNSERITFRECVFQNGRLPFDIYSWTGGLLLDNCSLDYNTDGEFKNRGGHLCVRGGHIETTGRTQPVCINSDTGTSGKSTFKEITFVNFGINGATVNLFITSRKQNCVVEDCRFTWAEGETPGLIATRNLRITDSVGILATRNWIASGEEGRTPMFSQGVIKSPPPYFIKRTVTGNLTVSRVGTDNNHFSLSTTDAAAASKSLVLVAPITDGGDYRFLSWMVIFSKCQLSANCSLTVYLSNDDGTIEDQIGGVYTFGNGTGTLKPANSLTYLNKGYTSVKFKFFLDPMLSADSIICDAIGAIAFS